MTHPIRVLVVDDDPDLAETIEDILTGWGHHVTVAHDGERAVQLFSDRPFDLCFMDVKLPGANGVDCFLEIRRRRPEAKVVMMTAYGVEDLLARATAGGALAVLHKPLDVKDILRAIERVGTRGVVLVVDDDEDFAESLAEALRAAGYSTLVACDGDRALEGARDGSVEVMVLDLRLPGLSGLGVYQELRRAGLAVPTVVVTGYPQEEAATLHVLKALDIRGVMVKPVDIRALLRVVEEVREPKTSRDVQAGSAGPEPPPVVGDRKAR